MTEDKSVDPVHEGGCLCGRVRYSVTGAPKVALICHCTICQRRTGSAFSLNAYFQASQVTTLSGALRQYEYRSDESNRTILLEFCESCGTTIGWAAEFVPGWCAIAGGTFDQPAWLKVERHVWTRSAHEWMPLPQDLDLFEKGSLG